MRDFLGYTEEQMEFRVSRLAELAADDAYRGQFDQVLLLDVIEHVMDAPAMVRQIHRLLDEDGFVYITTPDRDWQAHASSIRVSRGEEGWHVRNGYTFEQLERVLDENGFEPIDRLRFGTVGSTVVTGIQHRLFGRFVDPLTVAFFPILKLIALALSPGAIRTRFSSWPERSAGRTSVDRRGGMSEDHLCPPRPPARSGTSPRDLS